MSKGGYDNTVNCSSFRVEDGLIVTLSYPNVATDDRGNVGAIYFTFLARNYMNLFPQVCGP